MANPPRQVLILDDDRPVRELLQEIFAEAGYKCLTAEDGKGGLELFQANRPDLAVVDMKMPVLDGFEFLKGARALDPHAAIIMLTGLPDTKSAIECLKHGAADFILKPVNVDEVLIAAERALERRHLLIERGEYQAALERKVEEATRDLMHLAQHDHLTGLPNRSMFLDRLSTALARAERNRRLVALMFLDLDRFKTINDRLGHEAGDLLLQNIADRLRGRVRKVDTLSRWGGDEFTIIFEEFAGIHSVDTVAQTILEVIASPFMLAGQEVSVTASIGIALYPLSAADAQTLAKNADAALFRAKDQGGNTYQFYTEEMNLETSARLALQTSLRHALEREEFLLFYQPQLDLGTGRIVGMEALLRWQHPERGLLRPAQFLSVAEQSGQIVPIGEWALRQACSQIRAWQDAGFPPLRVAVNVSDRQFRQRTLAATVEKALRDARLDPQYLELEITEGHLMKHTDVSRATIIELKERGVRIAIDDFGTGYSSIGYLGRFPIDKLKIDQSFVRDVASNGDSAAIASIIITLAHSLRLTVLAEGVETEAQMAFFRAKGCEEIQGDLLSPPLRPESFERLLREPAR